MNRPESGPALLSPGQVCKLLRSRTGTHAAAADGRLPSIRLGGPEEPLRFIRGDVEAWLEDQRAAWTPGRR